MKYLILILSLVSMPAMADGFHIAVGLGIHDPAYDWHMTKGTHLTQQEWHDVNLDNPRLSNPLGIINVTYKVKKFTFGIEHISSIPNHRDGNGFNMVYVTVDIY